MKRRNLWLAPLLLALAHAPPASARLELSAEEREIVQWFGTGPVAGAETAIYRLVVYGADDTIRRLTRNRCPAPARSRERFTDPRYVKLTLEAARQLARFIDDDISDNGYLSNNWQAAAVYTWRNWSPRQRGEWLAYMRSPGARQGFDGWISEAILDSFEFYTGTDAGHSLPSLPWPGWLYQVLARGELTGSFRRAANALEPGLGDRFLEEAARPLGDPPSDAQRTVLVELSLKLTSRWDRLERALVQDRTASDVATARQIEEWRKYPLAREIAWRRDVVNAGDVSKEPPLEAFLWPTGQGLHHRMRREAQLEKILRPRVGEICDMLR